MRSAAEALVLALAWELPPVRVNTRASITPSTTAYTYYSTGVLSNPVRRLIAFRYWQC